MGWGWGGVGEGEGREEGLVREREDGRDWLKRETYICLKRWQHGIELY